MEDYFLTLKVFNTVFLYFLTLKFINIKFVTFWFKIFGASPVHPRPASAGKYEGGELVIIILCFAFTTGAAIMMTVIAAADPMTEKAAIVLSFQLWLAYGFRKFYFYD